MIEFSLATNRKCFIASHSLSEALKIKARNALSNALDAHRKELSTYESLKNLGEVIGTEYGERVLFELIQNAHDAHEIGEDGAITIKFVKTSEAQGYLYVSNRGRGFKERDVNAVMNLATSGKEIGEGIGNKGIGFRSIEAITDDVRIYSRSQDRASNSFDGYCFRFSQPGEIRDIILSELLDQEVREDDRRRYFGRTSWQLRHADRVPS